jgi:putative membrane protein
MTRAALLVGLLLVPLGWLLAGIGLGMVGHMAGHMIAVALAAPLLGYGICGSAIDPAARRPRLVTPMATMLFELITVWLWHLPALRSAAEASRLVMVVEQLHFLAAGWLLWASVLHAPQRMAGVGALLLTSMHMTLLGVLIGLSPRPLYAFPHHADALDPLADQQLGGVVMLLVGAASYMIGGLALLAGLIRVRSAP